MNKEDKFSINRVVALLKYHTILKLRGILLYIIISLAALQIPYLLALYSYYYYSSHGVLRHIESDIKFSIIGAGTIITFLLLSNAATHLMGSIGKKEIQRQLMLPARNSEKFLVSLLICVVGAILVTIAGHLLGMGTYCLGLSAMDAPQELYDCATVIFKIFDIKNIHILDDSNIPLNILFMLYSLYIWGATYFQKNRFARISSAALISWPLPYIISTVAIGASNYYNYVIEEETVIGIVNIILLLLPLLFIWLAWRNFKQTQIVKKERYMWILAGIIIVYIIIFGIYSHATSKTRKIVLKQERIERITEIDFPEFEYSEALGYSGPAWTGDYSSIGAYKFKETPSESFYNTLDSLSNIKGSYWTKRDILRDKNDPSSGRIICYYYSRSWGNRIAAPEGESPEADRYINIDIPIGVKDFKITFGAW